MSAASQSGRTAIRPQSPEAGALVDSAVACSPTAAALVDRLATYDVIALLELARVRRPYDGEFLTAGRLSLLTATPRARYVRIRLVVPPDPRIAVGMLVHELWHALEVAREPEVHDQQGMRQLYARIGSTGAAPLHFETDRAFNHGAQALSEVTYRCLADVRARRTADVVAARSPAGPLRLADGAR
jgi:hypothetical protein